MKQASAIPGAAHQVAVCDRGYLAGPHIHSIALNGMVIIGQSTPPTLIRMAAPGFVSGPIQTVDQHARESMSPQE